MVFMEGDRNFEKLFGIHSEEKTNQNYDWYESELEQDSQWVDCWSEWADCESIE